MVNISLKKTNFKPVRYKKKKTFQKRFAQFFNNLADKSIIENQFLKQHKTDLKQSKEEHGGQ